MSSKNHFCLTKEGKSLCHCVITVNLTESLGAHHTFIQILKLNCTQMLFPPPHKMGSMAIKWKTDHTAPCWPSLTCLSSKYLSNKRLWRTAHPLRGSVRDMKVLLFLPAADFRGLMNNSRRDEWRGGGRRYSGSTFIGFDVISSHLIYSCPSLCLCSWTAQSEKKKRKEKWRSEKSFNKVMRKSAATKLDLQGWMETERMRDGGTEGEGETERLLDWQSWLGDKFLMLTSN